MKKMRYGVTGGMILILLICGVYGIRKVRAVAPGISATKDEKTKGPANAPVQIVEYSDFQCPACQRASLTVKEIFTNPDYNNKVHFIFRHFPLPGHRWANLAHQAAECANQENRFWEFHDKLYAEQANWSGMVDPVPTFLLYAKSMNFPLENFAMCLSDQKVREKVIEDKRRGEQLQVNSTPTVFIDGERFVGPVEFQTKGIEAIRKKLGLPILPKPAPSPSPQAS